MLVDSNQRKLRTVILEDEPDNLSWLLQKLSNYPELELIGSAASIDAAFQLFIRTRPEAAFIDIELIGGNAFILLERLRQQGVPIPFIVIITGYPDYIWTAFNDYHYNIVKYLKKPIGDNWEENFRKSIDALLSSYALSQPVSTTPPFTLPDTSESKAGFLFLKNRGTFIRLAPSTICYLESAGGGESYLVTENETIRIDYTLIRIFKKLPQGHFIRISKSNIVNISKILQIHRQSHVLEIATSNSKPKKLYIGDTYYPEVLQAIQAFHQE